MPMVRMPSPIPIRIACHCFGIYGGIDSDGCCVDIVNGDVLLFLLYVVEDDDVYKLSLIHI